jgi:hypothetical protein
MNLRVTCPACQRPGRLDLHGPTTWQCPNCGFAAELPADALATDGSLSHCAFCGNGQLYRMKDFPQWLGMSILTLACGSFFVLAVVFFQYNLAWAILLGSAAVDGLIYLIVGDVVVCYRCGARHRGVPSGTFDPHELAIAEKYRQERIRKEQLQKK